MLKAPSEWELHEIADVGEVYDHIAHLSESRKWLNIHTQHALGHCPDRITLDWVLKVRAAYKKSRHDGREALVEALKFAGDLPEDAHGSDLWPLKNWVFEGLYTVEHAVKLWHDRSINVDSLDLDSLAQLIHIAEGLQGVVVQEITPLEDDGGPYAPCSVKFTTTEPAYAKGITLMVRRRENPLNKGGWALRVMSASGGRDKINEITTDKHRYYALTS